MKKALLLGAALMFIAGSASAQFVGLYTDETHTSWCYEGDNTGSIVYVYVFGQPNADGMKCLEFTTTVTGTGAYMAFAPTWQADVIDPKMGGFPGDLGACWGSCMNDWQWMLNAGLFIQSGGELTFTIEEFPGSPYPKILNCVGDGVEIEAYPMTNMCINQPCCPPINAVDESSWGAIKNLYE
jgi:hypothetical protein